MKYRVALKKHNFEKMGNKKKKNVRGKSKQEQLPCEQFLRQI